MKWGDVATWVGAVATASAAAIALWLGLRDGWRRRTEREADALALIAYLAPDMRTIENALRELIAWAEDLRKDGTGMLPHELDDKNEMAHRNLVSAALESRLDKLALLPYDLGHKASAVAGRLRSILARTQWVASNIRTTAPADYEAMLFPYIKDMRQALSDVRDVLSYAHLHGF